MGQLNQALTGGRAKIIDTTIVPMTVMLLVVVINSFMDTQYGSVEYTSYTYATENDGDLDAYDDKTPVSSGIEKLLFFIKIFSRQNCIGWMMITRRGTSRPSNSPMTTVLLYSQM